MKVLTEAQAQAVEDSIAAIGKYGSCLNSSQTGLGKTLMAVETAVRMKANVVVVAPKAVLPQWRREFAEHGILPLLVTNYEKIRRGTHKPILTQHGKRVMRWDVPENTLIIFDEVQRCKSPYSLNSLLLISAAMQNINTLLLSATACQDPTEMRAIGYALKLHSLNRKVGSSLSWTDWMLDHKCYQDGFGNWKGGNKVKLRELHDRIYADRAVRITTADMPEAFRENHIITEEIEFTTVNSIKRFYKDAGITPSIIEAYVEQESMKAAGVEMDVNALTEMLRARQLAECCKVADIVEMALDLIDEGRSVVVFLNFRESIENFKLAMEKATGRPVSLIIGGQTAEDREWQIREFTDDRVRCIVASQSAGGVGIDGLHDTHGVFPRVSLISPSFSAMDLKQTLGRLPRAYAKTGCVQKILIADGTIEEHVLKAINKKLASMEILHGK